MVHLNNNMKINVGGMSRGGSGAGKTATAKRVPPPAVPGDAFGTPQHRHSGSSFGSQGYASCEEQPYPQPPDTPSHTRDDHSDYGSTVSGVSGVSGASGSLGKSPAGGGTFTFPPPSQPLTHKAAVYYHHQLALSDDQGIDMTQSPGRDSPGSSSGSAGSGSRHSSASLDSGRASGRMPHHHHAACHCGDTVDRVRAMIAQGLPDSDIIHSWLADLQMEEYARLFIEAGYDLPTVTRMTPEDLTAVGIKKPNHRKRLKAELANLNVPDNLPDYIPGSLEEWLRLLRLEEYGPALVAQGYRTVHDVTQLAWEDLEDMGIVRLGHQKKILLAIKRVKDIRAGKRSISSQGSLDFTRIQGQDLYPRELHYQPWERHARSYHKPPDLNFDALQCGTDLVPIQIRHPRGKSLESLEDPSERTSHTTFSPEAGFYYGGGQWRRSYDDGDITPTNDSSYEGGGTLPRPRGLVRPRPVAKIQATPAYRDKSPDYTYDEIAYSARLQRVAYGASPHVARKPPPEPPKRQSSQYAPFTRFGQTTVEIHPEKSLPLSLPAYPSSDSLSVSLDSTGLLPPPPAPSSPPRRYDDDKMRTGSDASFKSSSSTESDSIPFANENAGTIKQNRGQIGGRPHTVDYGRAGIGLSSLPPRNPEKPTTTHPLPEHKDEGKSTEPVDVLNDIGNMLANLTDELDAMLEEEKRQGLADS
ncbi:uncharacterized protein ckn isoform X3 [Epargyreus clarus]|uniref:uncharacterized protein ckn isoform X3 n=1 Tax=Epargyreus clarus TaxID=520877 RepID=UPI003C2C35DF